LCCSTVAGEVAFTPNGEHILNAGHWPALWDAASGKLIARLTRERAFHNYRPIAFDGARNRALMGSQDGTIQVWDLAQHRLAAVSPRVPEWVDTIAVDRATGRVVYAGLGKPVRLWDPATGAQDRLAGAVPTSNILFMPDGRELALGTANGTVEFWNVDEKRRTAVLQ